MSRPSAVLDAVADALVVALSTATPDGEPAVHVMISDAIDEDVMDTETVPAPAVVVSCTGLTDAGIDGAAMTVDGSFVVRCYARVPKGPADLRASRGDVAMDLAALVAMVVDQASFLSEGEPLILQRAARITVNNRMGRTTAAGGHALWTVRFTLRFELTAADAHGALSALRRMHVSYVVGDADVPDQEQHFDLEGASDAG